ncbi:MAG TPA: aminotransferase class V-fold PLP-dependent enzyme, partial [Actinomycetes bacterium]|nr:aminotransferase class V-fold PLP-dependent enzyme [Actinomycetes bacterium]
MTYLDYAASAPLRPEALAAMLPLLERPAANPSSQHVQGRAARAAVETAREQVAALVGAAPGDVVFTSGGTEADNLAVKGTVLARAPEARHLVCSAVEHHAVLHACEHLGVARAPVTPSGVIDLDALAALLHPDVSVVSVMLANNEVGTVQPLAEVAEMGRLRHPREKDAGALLLGQEVGDRGGQRPLHDVVGEHDDQVVVVDEAAGQAQGLGDASGALLVGVDEAVDPVVVAAAEQAEELAGVGPPGHHHQLGDARLHQGFDGEADHRPVVDRQQ